ncbi:MAG: ABC transporter ATP-binding protein [Chloroflexi bacterium]|nr:ABC transporter ATP-binding protein [Chloroflexota bacterium]
MALAIETQDLTKTYGSFVAVDKLSLSVEEGEVFGFLGPNGAGKTTTILMLLGLTQATSGSARVHDYNALHDFMKLRSITGYLPENVGLYDDLTAEENLLYTARLNGLGREKARERIAWALARVGLAEVAQKVVGKFSRGMRQRLGIADVLIKQPRIVFLDEPTAGLDPEGVNQLLNNITSLNREEGITVFVSSHMLHQVQKICHRVGILSRGRMVALGAVGELSRQAFGQDNMIIEIEVRGEDERLRDSLKQVKGVRSLEKEGPLLVLDCEADVRAEVARATLESGCSVLEIRSRALGLEELYHQYFHEE